MASFRRAKRKLSRFGIVDDPKSAILMSIESRGSGLSIGAGFVSIEPRSVWKFPWSTNPGKLRRYFREKVEPCFVLQRIGFCLRNMRDQRGRDGGLKSLLGDRSEEEKQVSQRLCEKFSKYLIYKPTKPHLCTWSWKMQHLQKFCHSSTSHQVFYEFIVGKCLLRILQMYSNHLDNFHTRDSSAVWKLIWRAFNRHQNRIPIKEIYPVCKMVKFVQL